MSSEYDGQTRLHQDRDSSSTIRDGSRLLTPSPVSCILRDTELSETKPERSPPWDWEDQDLDLDPAPLLIITLLRLYELNWFASCPSSVLMVTKDHRDTDDILITY